MMTSERTEASVNEIDATEFTLEEFIEVLRNWCAAWTLAERRQFVGNPLEYIEFHVSPGATPRTDRARQAKAWLRDHQEAAAVLVVGTMGYY